MLRKWSGVLVLMLWTSMAMAASTSAEIRKQVDLAIAEAFYTSAFDLRIGRRFGDSAVELLGATSPLYLLRKPARAYKHGQ